MDELVITWRFKNQNWIEYAFCKSEAEFYSLLQKRYRIGKDQVEIIRIEFDTSN